jgi:RNA polymerase sigma-70 factor (ECF subfamily)
MPAPDERELIIRAREGGRDAFRLLVERHMKGVYDIAHHFLGDHEDAQDIAQEAFVRAHRSLGSFRGDAEFGTWLYRIVTNLSMNRIRQKKSRARFEVRAEEGAGEPRGQGRSGYDNPDFDRPDLVGHIEKALHELPTLQRAVVMLRHLNGLSTREVSSILNCSEGTVKVHLHRGLKKMKRALNYIAAEGV